MRIRHFYPLALLLFSVMILLLLKPQVSNKNENLPQSASSVETNGTTATTERNWIEISPSLYVYSAYLETRFSQPTIKIIAVSCSNRSFSAPIHCLMKLKNFSARSGGYAKTSATGKILVEYDLCKRPCKPVFIMCPIPKDVINDVVAIETVESKGNTLQWTQVKNLITPKQEPTEFAVCVRPMFNFTDTFRIAEFVSYYEALGATKFLFYNYNCDKVMVKYLEDLQKVNFNVEVLPWSHPFLLKTWEFAQMASTQDCIYRSMFRSTFVAVVDLDEFITPRKVMTLTELLQQYESKKGKDRVAEFRFRMTIFKPNSTIESLPPNTPPFVTQTSMLRQNFINPNYVRTKYVVKPKFVVVAGIHKTHSLINGSEILMIRPEDALINHYRQKESYKPFKNYFKPSMGFVSDTSSKKYMKPLLSSRALMLLNGEFPL